VMYATGNVRAMPFLDSALGYAVYCAVLWQIGVMWGLSRARRAVILLCIPFATLIKVNLTVVYLSVTAFLSIVPLSLDLMESEKRWRVGMLVGLIIGASLTMKSTNIVMMSLLVLFFFVMAEWKMPEKRLSRPLTVGLFLAIFVALPWSIANHRAEGTYLFPLLGKGYHLSSYGRFPSPTAVGSASQALFIGWPTELLLIAVLCISWVLTKHWRVEHRVIALSYFAAATVAAIVIAVGSGGESVDRYIAPIAMPALLLFLIVVLRRDSQERLLPGLAGIAVLLLASFYVWHYINRKLLWFVLTEQVAHQVVRRVPSYKLSWEYPLTQDELQSQWVRGRHIQASMPAGAVAIETLKYAFPFDFTRNQIYIADFPGMASLPPGMPIAQGPEALRQYLRQQGIQYLIYDRSVDPHEIWENFVRKPTLRLSLRELGSDFFFAHCMQPWGREEAFISSRVRDDMLELLQTEPIVYDDGTTAVARLD